jgi:hypothetical protein
MQENCTNIEAELVDVVIRKLLAHSFEQSLLRAGHDWHWRLSASTPLPNQPSEREERELV